MFYSTLKIIISSAQLYTALKCFPACLCVCACLVKQKRKRGENNLALGLLPWV